MFIGCVDIGLPQVCLENGELGDAVVCKLKKRTYYSGFMMDWRGNNLKFVFFGMTMSYEKWQRQSGEAKVCQTKKLHIVSCSMTAYPRMDTRRLVASWLA